MVGNMNIDDRIKPYEETWDWAERGGDDPLRGAARLYSDNHDEEWATTWGKASRDRAKLAAQAPAMARLLVKLARIDFDAGEGCGSCFAGDADHSPSCELASVLRAAGVLPDE